MQCLLFLLPFILNVSAHEFHLSKCLIEYNESEQALQISMHIFIDDLETALKLQGAEQLQLCTDKEDPEAETYLARYLQQQFSLTVNEQAAKYDFLGKETSDDLAAVWCYMEITGINQLQQVEVENRVLMDAFDDQKNIINIIGPNKKQGYFMFEKGKSTESVNFF